MQQRGRMTTTSVFFAYLPKVNVLFLLSIIGFISLNGILQFMAKKESIIKFNIQLIWLSFIATTLWSIFGFFNTSTHLLGFKVDPFSLIMMDLILFVSGVVHLFSVRYMSGDSHFHAYFLKLSLLTSSALTFVLSNHVFWVGTFWLSNQLLLSSLMIHKADWNAAKEGGILYLKNGIVSSLSLILALGLLAYSSKSFTIQEICAQGSMIGNGYKLTAFFLVLLSSVAQSGIWPFHNWLISSLNSPSPVSAFMHAGLVNGGGVLLIKFAPLLSQHSLMMKWIALVGVVSFVLGSIWKLMQNNVKKMLACSTMAQMGFMFLQCGIGIFPAAVAHICWHGCFKAFLFLNSGAVIETKYMSEKAPTVTNTVYSIFMALIGAAAFSWSLGVSVLHLDTNNLLIFFAAIGLFHVSLTTFKYFDRFGFLFAPFISIGLGSFYGASIYIVEKGLASMNLLNPQPLGLFHIFVLILVILLVISINYDPFKWKNTDLWKKIYVRMLNASQSDPKTMTTKRNEYQF